MNAVTEHPVSQRWKANTPEVLQLYSFPTPNGIKVSVALEELALPYEAHKVTLSPEDVKSAEFLSLNPNGKIPAIIDPDGPDGQPLALFESGAILIYLAEKTGKLMSANPVSRYQTLQWVMWQMGGVGPMFGQYGFFKVFGGKEIEDPRPGERYRLESVRLLNVLENHLEGRKYMVDDEYTIADISIFPWIRAAMVGYQAEEAFELNKLPRCMAYLERCLERPAVQRGLNIPPRD